MYDAATYLSRRILNRMGRKPEFDLVALFAALADPTRLRLLNLMDGREVCVCYFVEILKQGQPKISRHLAYLRRAGIVASRRDGKWMHYRIERPDDTKAASILDVVFKSFKTDRNMQADLARLGQACCEPQRFVTLQGAPLPADLERNAVSR
jgi:ArsR family transcriptional regulator, arsenate/arsenite/antimonite-responsive transcriptional repressor